MVVVKKKKLLSKIKALVKKLQKIGKKLRMKKTIVLSKSNYNLINRKSNTMVGNINVVGNSQGTSANLIGAVGAVAVGNAIVNNVVNNLGNNKGPNTINNKGPTSVINNKKIIPL